MGKTGGSLSRPKLPEYLLGLIVFFSATQLGLHFWPLSSLVYGVRIDYLAPTVYLFDLLLLGYLIARRSVLKRNSWLQAKKGSSADERTDLFGTLTWMLPILLTNLFYSANPLATLSWSLHVSLYMLLVNTLSWRLIASFYFLIPLAASMLFQAALAATQVALGHSVGGLLYYLGERMVAVGQPTVATASLMGETILRGYGTFGHPNVLAGWLVVCLLILIQTSQTATPKASKQRAVRGSDLLRKSWPLAKMFSRLNTSGRPGQTLWSPTTLYVALTALGVLLTQSRAATVALFGIVIPFYLFNSLKSRIIYCVFFLIPLSSFLFPSFLSPSRTDLSLSERHKVQGVSLSVIHALPIFGTGAQASISFYPTVAPSFRLLQPDHNSFTLFLSWFGVIGVTSILYALRPTLIPIFSFLIPLTPLLVLDHYFLTSPQGLFILLLYAKLSSCSK